MSRSRNRPIRQRLKAGTSRADSDVKAINLALQGGGSHGAFTWGVLDRLLEEERLSFEGISATSAGAVNAVVLADGLAVGGREGARDALPAPALVALMPSKLSRPSSSRRSSTPQVNAP
jgi:predicted acylesterase/phospholipase RssA